MSRSLSVLNLPVKGLTRVISLIYLIKRHMTTKLNHFETLYHPYKPFKLELLHDGAYFHIEVVSTESREERRRRAFSDLSARQMVESVKCVWYMHDPKVRKAVVRKEMEAETPMRESLKEKLKSFI